MQQKYNIQIIYLDKAKSVISYKHIVVFMWKRLIESKYFLSFNREHKNKKTKYVRENYEKGIFKKTSLSNYICNR